MRINDLTVSRSCYFDCLPTISATLIRDSVSEVLSVIQ